MTSPALTNRETRKLKAEAQKLIKIRFDHGRIERAALAGQVAKATGAAVIMQVGKVAVFYRPKPGGSKVAHRSNPHQVAL
jgi:RNA-binding protein YhbY